MWYEMPIVTRGIEKIRIVREGKVPFEGTVPAGFTYHLTIGDVVLIDVEGRYITKFAIVMWEDKPAIKFNSMVSEEDKNAYLVPPLIVVPPMVRKKTNVQIKAQKRQKRRKALRKKLARNFYRGEGYVK